MKKKTKKQIAAELNQFLLLKNIEWTRLKKQDLLKLHDSLMKLKRDVDEIFQVLENQIDEPRYCNPAYIV